VVSAGIITYSGATALSFPAGNSTGYVVTSIATLMTIVPAVALAVTLHHDMSPMDAAAPRDLRGIMTGHIVSGWVLAAALTMTGWGIRNGLDSSLSTGRDLTLWLGVALIAGRVLHPRLSWTGPVGVLPFLLYFGPADTGSHWWAWPLHPIDSMVATLGAVALLGFGIGGIWLPRSRPTHIGM
jgi:hypothetical protein